VEDLAGYSARTSAVYQVPHDTMILAYPGSKKWYRKVLTKNAQETQSEITGKKVKNDDILCIFM